MKFSIIFIIFFAFVLNLYGADRKSLLFGTNLLQYPTSTINLNISITPRPYFSTFIESGYTFNYTKFKKVDFIGQLLTSINDNGIKSDFKKQSGPYIKAGCRINLRSSMEEYRYFHLGLFFTNSFVYELITIDGGTSGGANGNSFDVEHFIDIRCLGAELGYNCRVSEQIKCCLLLQVAYPYENPRLLYSSNSFIPGIGISNDKYIPTLSFHIQY